MRSHSLSSEEGLDLRNSLKVAGIKADNDSNCDVQNLIQSTHIAQHYKYIINDTLLILYLSRQIDGYVKVGILGTVYRCLFKFVVKVQVFQYLWLTKTKEVEKAVFESNYVLIEIIMDAFVLIYIRADSSDESYVGCLLNLILNIHELFHVNIVVQVY